MNDYDFWRTRPERIRDVGVAGSNPVTPTIDFIRVFTPLPAYGARSPRLTVPKTVPVSARKNHARFRLSSDACGRISGRTVNLIAVLPAAIHNEQAEPGCARVSRTRRVSIRQAGCGRVDRRMGRRQDALLERSCGP